MKGICFIEPLFGLVTQLKKKETRRVITPQPQGVYCFGVQEDGRFKFVDGDFENPEYRRPRYQIGDKVYLKEPYYQPSIMLTEQKSTYIYRYTPGRNTPFVELESGKERWANKLFMPARASRYYIEITDVKAEQLQDIGHDSCIFEGIQDIVTLRENNTGYKHRYNNGVDTNQYIDARDAYQALINKIDGKGTWDSNPWVFVYNFKLTIQV